MPPVSSSPRPRWTLTQWGLVFLAIALLLGLLPQFLGVGWFWSVVLLIGGVMRWRQETNTLATSSSFWASPGFGLA